MYFTWYILTMYKLGEEYYSSDELEGKKTAPKEIRTLQWLIGFKTYALDTNYFCYIVLPTLYRKL
jgi:hypothetical protein